MIPTGAALRITEGYACGAQVVIWSAAPGPGTYWAHLDSEVVLIKVVNARDKQHVTVEEHRA